MATCNALPMGSVFPQRLPVQPTLIDSIGTASFLSQFCHFLDDICGAELCRIYQVLDDSVQLIDAPTDRLNTSGLRCNMETVENYWLAHPAACELRRGAHSQPILIRVSATDITDLSTRDRIYRRAGIRDMAMVWSVRGEAIYGFTAIRKRSSECFSAEEITEIGEVAESLISTIAKHADMLDRSRFPSMGLRSLSNIENVIANGPVKLPRRETQVCAQILYGVSMAGIASALGIAEESVVTYRKRAYSRLGIASRQ